MTRMTQKEGSIIDRRWACSEGVIWRASDILSKRSQLSIAMRCQCL